MIGSAQSALYEYNAENKLVKATVQNGSLVIEESYTYDYQGNRTSKSTHKSNGEYENLSSQAYAHVFSANFAADCVKNSCRATARLRIFALSATKLCSKIRTHFL